MIIEIALGIVLAVVLLYVGAYLLFLLLLAIVEVLPLLPRSYGICIHFMLTGFILAFVRGGKRRPAMGAARRACKDVQAKNDRGCRSL